MKLFTIISYLLIISVTSFAQTLPPAFTSCPSTGFQVVNNPSDFQTVNLATGTTTTVVTFPIYVNAIGFNPNDNRIYGIRQTSLALVAIGSDYSYDVVTTSGAALQGSVVGDISPAGYLWCQGSTNIYKVDCNPSDGANFGRVTLIGPKSGSSFTDWSFPTNDTTRIYTVNSSGALIYISTSDLSVHTVLAAGAVPAASYGATYFDSDGNFYAKSNTTGIIYKFKNATTASPTVVTFSTSSASGQNDGARCANAEAPVIADFGDAPDSYGTYTSSGGPVHLQSSPNPALATVYLGSGLTIDADGQPGIGANLDTDDGVASFPAIMGGDTSSVIASYAVTVTAHNGTASVANVAGWIDWNNNGTFDAGEIANTTVAAGFTGNTTLTWSNITLSGPIGTPGTYARFRISTDALTSPGGTVSNGEVEDYFIPYVAVLPVSLRSFNVSRSGTSAHITWVTASEQNNKGFFVERSQNGISFTEAGFVASKATGGSSSSQLQYDYYDMNTLSGISYYRLKQVNKDNKLTYSNIAKIIFGKNGNNVIIYPNPARSSITIDGLKGNEDIQLYNLSGQLVKKQKATGSSILTLDINDLPHGIYRLTIIDATGARLTEKIVKE